MPNPKIDRLWSGGINLLQSLPPLVQVERHYAPLLATIDRDAISAIIARFAADPDFADGRKYLRLWVYLRDCLARTRLLGLDGAAPKRVLDVGSGAGYFLAACRYFGHSGLGFDLPGNAFYRAMFEALDLDRVEGAVMPLTPLEGPTGQFDVVTAFAVTFSKRGRTPGAIEWTGREWNYFLDDLRRRFLKPGGRVFLRLNLPEPRGLHDLGRYGYFREPPPEFDVNVLNRREVVFSLRPSPGAVAP